MLEAATKIKEDHDSGKRKTKDPEMKEPGDSYLLLT